MIGAWNHLILFTSPRNRTQEADGSIPFISTIIEEFGSHPQAVLGSLNSGTLRGVSSELVRAHVFLGRGTSAGASADISAHAAPREPFCVTTARTPRSESRRSRSSKNDGAGSYGASSETQVAVCASALRSRPSKCRRRGRRDSMRLVRVPIREPSSRGGAFGRLAVKRHRVLDGSAAAAQEVRERGRLSARNILTAHGAVHLLFRSKARPLQPSLKLAASSDASSRPQRMVPKNIGLLALGVH